MREISEICWEISTVDIGTYTVSIAGTASACLPYIGSQSLVHTHSQKSECLAVPQRVTGIW